MSYSKCKKACKIEASTVQMRDNTVRMVQACADCTQKCLSNHIHEKEKPYPVIPSFFKVMIGDRFSDLLVIPPKFVRTMTASVGQKIELGDSSGHRWLLELACIDGSLAFQQGWKDFSMDHGLEIGDFVVFDCISASHFRAKIYKRTGCEKLDFLEEGIANKKRKVSSYNTLSGCCHIPPKKSSMDNQASNTILETNQIHIISNNVGNAPTANSQNRRNTRGPSQSKTKYVEEPSLLVNREYRGEDRRTLFDLSDFEIGKRNCNVYSDAMEDKNLSGSKSFPTRDARYSVDSACRDTMPREVNPCEASTKKGLRDTCDKVKDVLIDTFKMEQAAESTPPEKCRNAVEKETMEEMTNSNKGKEQIKIQQSLEPNVKLKVVKSELDMPVKNDDASNMAADVHNNSTTELTQLSYLDEALFSCVVHEENFLELPMMRVPLIPKVKKKSNRALMYLRDVEARVWPLMYHEQPSIRVITNGWRDFKDANRIQVGDECIFVVNSSIRIRDMFNVFVRPKATRGLSFQSILQ